MYESLRWRPGGEHVIKAAASKKKQSIPKGAKVNTVSVFLPE